MNQSEAPNRDADGNFQEHDGVSLEDSLFYLNRVCAAFEKYLEPDPQPSWDLLVGAINRRCH